MLIPLDFIEECWCIDVIMSCIIVWNENSNILDWRYWSFNVFIHVKNIGNFTYVVCALFQDIIL